MVEILALAIPILALSIPIVALLTRYQIERAKILASRDTTSTAELRKMLEELRETTTQYDLALDQTLQRIERKLDDLENRVAQLEQQQSQQVMR
jgi:septal ring factor EnvC (AmiA/AmiB activator)